MAGCLRKKISRACVKSFFCLFLGYIDPDLPRRTGIRLLVICATTKLALLVFLEEKRYFFENSFRQKKPESKAVFAHSNERSSRTVTTACCDCSSKSFLSASFRQKHGGSLQCFQFSVVSGCQNSFLGFGDSRRCKFWQQLG